MSTAFRDNSNNNRHNDPDLSLAPDHSLYQQLERQWAALQNQLTGASTQFQPQYNLPDQTDTHLLETSRYAISLLNNAPDGIAIINLAGDMLYVNHAYRMLQSETDVHWQQYAEQIYRTGTPIFEEITCQQPEERTCLRSVFPLYNEQNGISTIGCIVTNITATKQTEEELRQTRNQMEQRVWERTADLARAVAALRNEITERKQIEQALRESETRYRIISELGSDFAFAFRVDPTRPPNDSLVKEWISDAVTHITGYTAAELTSDFNWYHLIYIDDHPLIDQAVYHALEGRNYTLELRIITRAGDVRWLRTQLQPAWDAAEGRTVRIYGVASDITYRKRAAEQIHRQVKRLSALRQIDLAISSSMDLDYVLQIVLEHVTVHLQVDAGAVLLLNPANNTLQYAAGRGFRHTAIQQHQLAVGQGCPGKAAQQCCRVYFADLQQASTDDVRAQVLQQEGMITYYGMPLVARGQVRGVLEIFHRHEFEGNQEWLDFLEALANQVAIALDNTSLFQDLQHANHEMTLAYNATIEGWARALELRDVETEGHTRRVTEQTVRLAQAMGCTPEEIVHIRQGAILHDIGKMAIPDSILLKPGPLTDEEWEVMRQHPVYAYQMLSSIDFLKPALTIPYYHHERWDGSGYPSGLQARDIPLEARLFAVVDVWDALRSDRPYRKGWPTEKVTAYLQEQAGSHFDPDIVSVFLNLDGTN